MAYPTRGRDPLFDSATQATLERRGRELLGLALVTVGLAIAALLSGRLDAAWDAVAPG